MGIDTDLENAVSHSPVVAVFWQCLTGRENISQNQQNAEVSRTMLEIKNIYKTFNPGTINEKGGSERLPEIK